MLQSHLARGEPLPIRDSYRWFEEHNLRWIPDLLGVYQLETALDVLYIGTADDMTLRDALRRQYEHRNGVCARQANWFRYEVTADPAGRVRALLEEYREAHGHVPRCNALEG